MSDYLLYGFKESGNAYKAALTLEVSGCDWRCRWVDFFNGETKGEAYREEVNAMGEVPVLEHRSLRLAQSGVILDYLTAETGKFGPASEGERREILRWVLWDNHKLTSYTATYRFLRTFVPNADPAVLEFFRQRMIGALSVLDRHLTDRTFIATGRPTTADLSICGYLFFEDEFGVDWSGYPGIERWLARIKDMPGWQHPYDLLPDRPTG
ncbi:MAG: glutathione S-transferase family protein [Pseudomonadota bacterium]